MKILTKSLRSLWRWVAEDSSHSGWLDSAMLQALVTIDHFEALANDALEVLNKAEVEAQELRDDLAQPAEDLDDLSWLDDKRRVNPLSDSVQSPAHYDLGNGIEVIDVIKNRTQKMGGHAGYIYGNAIKYLLRAPFKGAQRLDILKCKKHLEWILDNMESKK